MQVVVQIGMNLQQIHKYIEQAADEAQRLLDAEFAKCNNQPTPGSALDQAGLRNGKEIVINYLSHGEPGVALEHLVYMVQETGIAISEETRSHTRCSIGNADRSIIVTNQLYDEVP